VKDPKIIKKLKRLQRKLRLYIKLQKLAARVGRPSKVGKAILELEAVIEKLKRSLK
jgi:hypothetical protein